MPEDKPEAVESGAVAAAATDASNDQSAKPNDASESKDEASTAPQTTEGATEAKDAAVEAPAPAASETEKKEADSEVSQKRRREDDDRRGRGPAKRFRKGTMFDPTIQDITDDPLAIRKQVEFYFSDANLARDKFLFDKLEGSKNTPIDIQVIHSFKRMRRYQPYEAVVKALKESDTLEVTEDEKLRRKQPLSADFENKTLEEITKAHDDESMVRSVYVKGFGYEKPSTQFDIEAWFANYGTLNQVRLRRLNDKTFKGSVFAEFDSEEAAKKFIALDPPPKYNDKELKIMSKKGYCEEKAQLVKDGVLKPNNNGGYDHADRAQRSGGNERDWRERREEDRKNGFRSGGRGSHRGGRGRGGRGRGDRNDRSHHRSDRDGEAADANGNAESKNVSGEGATTSEKPTQEQPKAEAEA